jgi:hypothetical protein
MLTPNLCHSCSLSPPPNCSKSPQPPSQNQSNSLQRLCWSRTPPCTQRIRERRRRAHRPRRIRRHIIRNADAVVIAQLYTGTWTFPFSKNILTQTNGDQGLTILQHHGVPGHSPYLSSKIWHGFSKSMVLLVSWVVPVCQRKLGVCELAYSLWYLPCPTRCRS